MCVEVYIGRVSVRLALAVIFSALAVAVFRASSVASERWNWVDF